MTYLKRYWPVVYLVLYRLFISRYFLRGIFDPIWFGVFAYLLLAGLGLLTFREEWRRGLKVLKRQKEKIVFWLLSGFVANFVFQILFGIVSQFLLAMIGQADYVLQNEEHVAHLLTSVPLPLVLLAAGISGPLVEELAYRVVIFSYLKKWLPLGLAMTVQAVIFGMIHMHVLSWAEFLSVLPHMGSGLVFGYLYHKTESLPISWGVHSLWNIMALLLGA
ncbi:CPBP family intramembrane glutamic endopeptidase [Streptococcus ovuberis]|uniref:CPBP family intramembrane metalloprotease n=1 Tax=Streptococcus ovuberis TaxID=1936207 RepID=A0A7X6S0X6_9STRE|nr:CPBP family intramembrane glutamic endopeptidase [Streptococcus ovuberis]NKZ20222.1 CPBP family intramembrane metalloprotease [Streptococcus ovuberis]